MPAIKMKTPYSLPFTFLTLLFLAVLVGTAVQPSYGQQTTYGNEWINYSQKYYKIKVPATGIYRLDRNYLQAAGISGVDPRNLQLYRRGQEVAILVSGEADGSFDAGDFLEFYGEKNDGALDAELYKDPADQLNPHYSLYTDTASYFLTWSTRAGKRMQVTRSSPANITPEPWFWQTRLIQFTDSYSRGKAYGSNHMSWMDSAEGFMSGASSGTRNVVVDSLLNLYNLGPKPTVEVALAGSNASTPDVDVYAVNGTSERLLGNLMFPVYGSAKRSFPLEFSDIAANGRVTIRFISKNGSSTRVSYVKVKFPQRPIMHIAALGLENATSTTGSTLYNLEGTHAANAVAYDITSATNVVKIEGVANGTQRSFVFTQPASSSLQKGLLWAKAPMVPVSAREVKFRSFSGNSASYLILSHKSLMASFGTSTNPVKDYASYRASAAGGRHDTLVVDVDQLYDQFFYGDKSAASIRRFMKYMLAHGTPKYLFILGKGIEPDNVTLRRTPHTLAAKDLIPTGGVPSSDVFFTSNWELDQYEPLVATGRLPAQTPADVLAYLEKVKEHESLPQNAEWRKNILHLGGGTTPEEGKKLESYLNSYKAVIEGKLLGAEVKTRARESHQNLEVINVASELNRGLSLITFFGHSSSTTSDLDIGYVSAPQNGYNNRGKYPMILMNGCGAGNSSTVEVSFGENWLLTPAKGALLFMAHTSTGYPTLLYAFSRTFYEVAFSNEEFYGKPVGVIQQETVRQLDNSIAGFNSKAMLMQMDLKGDPAVALVAPQKPDYTINNSSLSIKSLDGRPLSAATEKFAVAVDIRNLGKAVDAPFYVKVKRVLPNGEVLQLDSVEVSHLYNRDTVEVMFESKVPVPGVNYFEATVDSRNTIEEIEEANNTARFEFFFPVSSVLALAPKNYSIVPTQTVKLIGQSTNLLTKAPDFYFEIDTVSTFNSAWKKSTVIPSTTLPIWEVTLLTPTGQNDSIVYFWRFRNKDIDPQEEVVWATSSFRHIPNSPAGWSQSKIAQLTEAGTKDLELDVPAKKMEFKKNVNKYIMIRGVGGNIHFGFPPNSIYIEGTRTIDADCYTDRPNMMAIVFDDKTLEPYMQMPEGLASLCGRPKEAKITYNFVDLRKPENLDKLEAFLRSVPDGYYVAMVGMRNVPYNTMSESLKAQFRGLGSALIDQLTAGDPFAIIGRKGAAMGTAQEVGPVRDGEIASADQAIVLEGQIKTSSGVGSISSTLIGPAKEWKSLQHQLVLENSDSYQLSVIGVDLEGKETTILKDVKSSTYDLSSVNPAIFPYLKLNLSLSDLENRSAPLLKEWLVLYEEVPEGVLRPDIIGLEKYASVAEQAAGGEVELQYAFHNITNIDFPEQLSVVATFFKDDGTSLSETFKVDQLLKQDTIYFKHKVSTLGLKGANRIRINVNPQLLPEQNYFNNTLEIPFNIGDFAGMPPVLDVAFDGSRILDGDIVSPSPVISIQLKDNSGKLPVKQSQKMKVYLRRPNATQAEEILVDTNQDVRVFPADEKNDLRVEYNPKMLPNGTYTLEAEGLDMNNNKLGGTYKINFIVENESSVTNFYPYPNPFSSKTRFIFTLTGSYIPERIKIQILTVTGKVVREIQKEELGALKIGNNITEFAWDGTDEFGDRLANGVYLYRVMMDTGATEMKHRTSKKIGDKGFKEGYGKIYILR
ncbi:C25 family cysteine peptidase [Rufibacter quisquiliarum]|uniref:putative type IX secretion system sortase PorU2 n=2 Tax=Rufibacter quisquiliarum TaxID=1549639 RepID=UPI0031B5C229